MSTKWNGATRDGCGQSTGELLNVILVYEDQSSAQRGLVLYQHLMTDLGVEYEFNLNVWKFAVLALARLDEISAEQAMAADLVIVCTREDTTPTERTRVWLERWLELKGRDDCALVLLRETAPEPAAPTQPVGFHDARTAHGGIACFPPAATRAFAAQVEGRGWLSRRLNTPALTGWFLSDRHSSTRA